MTILQSVIAYISALLISLLPVSSYTEGVIGQPQSFLPSQARSQNDKTISKLIYRGLFKYDIYGALIPDLAETWTMSDGGLVYTIKLKDNARWSNGKKITSDDLIYTSFKIADLQGVATDKVDELTVRYTLPNRYAPFLNLLTVSIMPANAEEKSNSLRPVTSGDFTVGRLGRSGASIKKVTLVSKSPEHKIKKLVFKYYSNEDELTIAARLGEIDGFLGEETHKLENFEIYRFPLQGIYYALFFNLRDESVEDLALRQKLEKVLPLEKMVVGKGIQVQGAVSRSLFTDKSLEFDKYDELFSEDLGDVTLTITLPDIEKHTQTAKTIRDIWEDKLDVKVVLRKIAPEDFTEKVIEPRDFQILLYGQEVGRDPDRYVVWHSTQQTFPGHNLSGFSHVRADRALEEGRNELDNEERVIHYDQFQEVVYEQVPAIFLYHPFKNYYVSKYITGIGEKYTFTPVDRFLDFANWKRVKTN